MGRTRNILLRFALACLGCSVVIGAAAAEPRHPIVVELYTSQGCNSCPPADAFLGSLKGRDGIVALSFHVNYWDYLGWDDTFATKETTARQRRYAETLGERTIYTPQIVIGGIYHEVGSRHRSVEKAIRKIAVSQGSGSDEYVAVSLSGTPDGELRIDIAPGHVFNRRVAVWLVVYDTYHEVRIGRGENGGRTLGYHNVVRDLREIGEWYGQKTKIVLNVIELREVGEGVAVLVQEDETGRILGAKQSLLAALPRN